MTLSTNEAPVVVSLVDDGDLAVAGLTAMLGPFTDRIELLDIRGALANPQRLDVILYEPIGQSAMSRSLLRDLYDGGEARCLIFSWATANQFGAEATGTLSKMLTASQLVVAIEQAAADPAGRGGLELVSSPSDNTESFAATRRPAESVVDLNEAGSTGRADGQSARIDDDLPVPLTPRELDVLRRIVAGLSNREISEDLELSLNSVKTYVRSAYRKIGVIRRTQAVLWGVGRGLAGGDRQPRAAG